jgi:phosphatidylinositol alpha-1,6-mannosyltransferase
MDSTARSGRQPGERPRLLILTPDFPPSPGGIQVVAHRLASGLAGFATSVVTPNALGAAAFDAESGVRTHRVRGGGTLRGGRNALLNAAALAHAAHLRPDITLSAHIVTSPAAAAIARTTRAHTVQYFHAEEIGAKPRLAAFAANHAQASIAVSAYTAGLVAATGATARRLTVIGNGTDLPSDASAQPGERPTILTIARIEERYKGHDTIVRALPLVLAKVPDAQWVVIGDGSLRPGFEQLAASHGVEHAVRFLGAVEDEQRNSWLRRAHLLAMPSRLPAGGFAGEGFGIVYLEAGAYGKPVIAGNVGGALDAVRDGETGLLVDPLDPLALAEAITTLLLDRELAARLGEAGRAWALQQSWPLVVARVEEVLLGQLAGSQASTLSD